MSAFLCSDSHVNQLVTWAARRPPAGPTSYYWPAGVAGSRRQIRGREQEVATILRDENLRSLASRYSSRAEVDAPITYRRSERVFGLPVVAILKACACFDYQACESDDYYQTEAAAIIEAIRHDAIRGLPGYDDSEGWELADDTLPLVKAIDLQRATAKALRDYGVEP